MPVVRGKDIEVLFSASAIARRNLELAKEIAGKDYTDLLVISVLKGSFIFAADLIRAMHDVGLSPEVEFIFISSYGAGTTSGEVRVLRDIDNEVAGRDVLLIDDILESGKTLKFARELMLSRGAASCSIAVLLDKRMRRQTDAQRRLCRLRLPGLFRRRLRHGRGARLPRTALRRHRQGRRLSGMARPSLELHGYRYSVYLRIAAMTLIEKGVAWTHVEVDPFDEPIPQSYLALNPFGRVPTLVHDGFVLYETTAITRYIDEAFPGPSLQPVAA